MDEPYHDHREEEDGEPAKRRGERAGRHPPAVREPRRHGNRAYADYVLA